MCDTSVYNFVISINGQNNLLTNIAQIKSIDGLEILIIKPTMLGGIEKSWQMMQQAKGYGLRTVLSSSFESSIGILTLANLAGCANRYSPSGFDTLKWFKQDVLKKPLTIEHGKIDIRDKVITSDDVNFDLLEKIPC